MSISAYKGTPILIFLSHPDLRERRTIDYKMEFSAIIEKIKHKTLNKFAFAVVTLFWILFYAILIGAFSDMEYNEPRYDFRCDVTAEDKVNADFIRSECYNHYLKQNHKLLIPPLLFVLVNMSLVPIVTAIYSFYANSIVKALKRSHQDAQTELRDRGRNLFFAYLCQLIINILFEITFIILLETQLLYPRNFPTHFSCSSSVNGTQSITSFNCSNHRAASKSIWIRVVTAANGIFALFAFLEIIWILSRCRHGKEFMENWRFYADHLNSNSDEQRQRQNDFHSAIKTLKENCLQDTEKLSDLKQPFGQPNHGEGDIHDLTIDKVYVHVVIVEGRAFHKFAEESRSEQLQEYPPDAKDCNFAKPGDILDENHKNVLVVGRPGIGKTSFSTKLLRLWASGEAFKHFNVVFLLKFRRFNNDNANLSLRDLIARSETVHNLDDAVWDFIKKKPTKVLLIFDGLDEYSRKKDIEAQEDDLTYKNCVEEKMPVSVLYNKLAEGKLFSGASIITTTRPTAVKCVRHVRFQRTVEIRGFTSDDVKEYVENFSRGYPQAMEKIWEHIKSNMNLFSFCYIPMNCFLICHCLLQIILSESSQALPTKMTDIYKITVKMFLLGHNREGFSPEELARLKSTHMDEPFDKLPEELQKVFRSLGEIAFKGIEEGRLLFESSEVSGLEDCGLLHKLPDLKRKALDAPSKSQFCFTHLTVQEFFAAKHLVDTMTDEGSEEFVCNHINDGTWQVVLQFAAGLLKSSLSSHIFMKLLPESTKKEENPSSSKSKTLTSWPAIKEDIAMQVCKCLYEINDEQQHPVLQNKIEKIKFNAVDFSRCSLAPIGVAAVVHFLENAEEVLYINLYYNSLGDLGANEVKKFIVHRGRKLQSLELSSNGFSDSAAKDFAAALKHSNCKLESLNLSLNEFTDNAAKDFAAALQHSNCKLESLNLSGNEFTDNAAKDFAAALIHSNCKLESLDLGGNKFTDNSAKDFAAALKHSNCKLKSLVLRFNHLTDTAAKDFAAALKDSNCKLELLDLSVNDLTDNAAKDFAAALKNSNCKLESLSLSRNEFTNNAAKDFAAALMHSNSKLKSLDLGGNKFTDNSAKDFAAALKHSNCKLKSLVLRFNHLTDTAAKDFVAALKDSNCKLELLDLSVNDLTDNAAKDFAAALKHSNCKLESLNLSGNEFTDNAAKDFAAALKHSNFKLEKLVLSKKNFTAEGRQYLTDAGKQSNCIVVWSIF